MTHFLTPLFGDAAVPAMPPIEIPWWAWTGFLVFIALMLLLDLGVFHKKDKVLPFKDAVTWSCVWIALAAVFAGIICVADSTATAEIFVGGYLLELALSVDNLFVFLMVFSFFHTPEKLQHRVLFWGIIGAIVMRALFIWGGVALVEKFDFLMYIFGAFLIFTGLKMALPDNGKSKDLEKNIFVRLGKTLFPMTPDLRGAHFFVREAGKWLATPLFLILLVIEGTDVVFAVDSIPAIMGILPKEMPYETKLFVAFTSNIFAILGLRSLFFAIAGFMKYFRFLKLGLAAILVFIGGKMIAGELCEWHLSPTMSLAVLGSVLFLSIAASAIPPKNKTTENPRTAGN